MSTNVDAIVLDIEGTITPITFVKDCLFPYVLRGLDGFLDRNWGSPELSKHIDLLREQAHKDVGHFPDAIEIPQEHNSSPDAVKAAIRQNIEWQMKADRKIGALKAFQGYMWEEGYANQELCGEIYADVVPKLKQWHASGKKLYIYSSGSVPAQKLLLGHSTQGNLLRYFSGFYDTRIGLKLETESYRAIARDIGVANATDRILFVSDNIKEIIAAHDTGYQVVISDRPGNAPLDENSNAFKVITSFDQIGV